VTGNLSNWNIRWKFGDKSFNKLKLPVSLNTHKDAFCWFCSGKKLSTLSGKGPPKA